MQQTPSKTVLAIALVPATLSTAAIEKHIENIRDQVNHVPDNWNSVLMIESVTMQVGFEIEESEARLKLARVNLATDLSAEARNSARCEYAQDLITGRAYLRLGKLSLPVVEAVFRVAEARAALAGVKAIRAEDEAAAALIQSEINERDKPHCEKECLAVAALKDEEKWARQAMTRGSNGAKEDIEEELRELVERKQYNWQPTEEGYEARMDEIEEEIERLEEIIDSTPVPDYSSNPTSDLCQELRRIQGVLRDSLPDLEEAENRLAAAEFEVETEVSCYRIEARGILRRHELDSEESKLEYAS